MTCNNFPYYTAQAPRFKLVGRATGTTAKYTGHDFNKVC
jgi:hypothetical protein